jgi:hypothetical protein
MVAGRVDLVLPAADQPGEDVACFDLEYVSELRGRLKIWVSAPSLIMRDEAAVFDSSKECQPLLGEPPPLAKKAETVWILLLEHVDLLKLLFVFWFFYFSKKQKPCGRREKVNHIHIS